MLPRSLASTLLILLAACGGGGGGGGGNVSPPTGPAFTGTVAIGEPVVGAGVSVQHVDSGVRAIAITGADGGYLAVFANDPGGRPLFLIDVEGGVTRPSYPQLYSIANRAGGTVNVTPLTTLLVSRLLGERLSSAPPVTGAPSLATLRNRPTPSDADIAAARQQVATYLLQRPNRSDPSLMDQVDVSAVTDFIGASFTAVPGNPHDDAIERFAQTLMRRETIDGVQEHMLFGNDPPADLLSVLSLDFDADCAAHGTPITPLPSGRLRITLTPTGQITIGSFNYTLTPDLDIISRGNSIESLNGFWSFQLNGTGTGDSIGLTEVDGRLTLATLSRSGVGGGPGGGTTCTPATEVRFGARSPSTLALVRLLAAAFNTPRIFNCPAGTFPGIAAGLNPFEISSHGALRVTAGHSLHLPSLGGSVTADIVNNAGVLGTRVVSASFSRTFEDGFFESFEVTLETNGDVQTVDFEQRPGGGTTVGIDCQ